MSSVSPSIRPILSSVSISFLHKGQEVEITATRHLRTRSESVEMICPVRVESEDVGKVLPTERGGG
jgi:hypothetical protein